MGCSNEKMVQVETTQSPIIETTEKENNLQNKSGRDLTENTSDNNQSRKDRMTSAISQASEWSRDSGLGEGETESLRSVSTTTTGRSKRSGGLKRTLRNLSARSNTVRPRENEDDVLKQLRSEGLLTSQTQTAKSGISFQLVDENATPKRIMPARLAKLEKRQKRRKLLTQQDIENKLKRAEERRKEVEAERLEKIHSVTVKCDIQNALSNFTEHQKQVAEQVQEKVESAAEKRARQFKEMRERLKAREAHAAEVRKRKLSRLMMNNEESNSEKPEPGKSIPRD